ncbi:alpha-N-acetylgalactosaminide alpha-2,6-sialyltransferase 1 [Perognathus longimembris pacificus]|uniref:alpha-N-acetylgalactosaminide alpha-2,6-sialyltransferase 1 n=1 Tax=Perognathus longimembris pacificus TaxID=214514 RepID=UPI002018D771|nr:alpha-N-acetylgalactosaminide alpha-2,6-sialyltransferase 1 [Perognathus longimembris pacificus]
MRACPLGPSALWHLLLAALVLLLFTLPSFIKEPNTKPSSPAPQELTGEPRPAQRQGRKGPSGSERSRPQVRTKRQAEERGGQRDDAETRATARVLERWGDTSNVTAATTRTTSVSTAPAPAKSPPAARPWPPNATTPTRPPLKATNFKSEPRWDFEEEYSLDVGGLQTNCPDSVKVRASRSPWLGKLFLPSPLLFLDSARFSPREWARLEHFVPPFGFMELNRSLVQKVVSRFPPVPQQQLLLAGRPPGGSRCLSCAVVGNGGILNNSRMGREIDGHDYVFRLSGALLRGYERDVGTRTSFYGFTAFSLTQSLLALGARGFRHVPVGADVHYLHFLEGSRDYEWLDALLLNETLGKKTLPWFRRRPQEVFPEALRLDRYFLLHPDFLRYVKNRFLRSKTLDTARWRIYRPTTGALLLLTALHLCDKVSAYGFITQGHERFSGHYYDKTWKQLIFYVNHDFPLERKVWKQLHDEGIIWLYQRPQTTKAPSSQKPRRAANS